MLKTEIIFPPKFVLPPLIFNMKNEYMFFKYTVKAMVNVGKSVSLEAKIWLQKGHLGIWNRKLKSENCQQYHTLIKCVPTHSLNKM